jgi:hexosaminidase
MRIQLPAAISAAFLWAAAATAAVQEPTLIPQPQNLTRLEGAFKLVPATRIYTDAASVDAGHLLAAKLRQSAGWPFRLGRKSAPDWAPTGGILLTTRGADASLGAEGYELVARPNAVMVRAPAQAGLFYGLQTLLQLLPPEIFSTNVVRNLDWQIPCVRITDQPRFKWRGLMLDSGHDFQNKDFVKRYLDLMALHKFNLFHWHLTDLGTWSVAIKSYPKLLEPETRAPGVKPGYYTQDEIREVVRYAAARHITILPEIDMPGHESPALLAYPELDCPLPHNEAGWPYNTVANGKPRPWEFCVGNEKTYVFLETVLSQMVELFPGPYIDIGGDECPKERWLHCPLCQAKMKQEQLATGEELQSYFIRRMEKFLQSKGRRLIGWDEILEGGLAPNATVMSWRGMGGGIAAAKAGHDVVMAPGEWTYFDNPKTPLEKVYSFEPVPKELAAAPAAHVLGAEAEMWADLHPSEKEIEALVYPRATALAEVLWSPKEARNFDDFRRRLQTDNQRLDQFGVNYQHNLRGP